MEAGSNSVPDQLPHDAVTCAFRHLLHCVSDIAHVIADPGMGDARRETLLVTSSNRSASREISPTANVAAESA
jgi:hypothetical protein